MSTFQVGCAHVAVQVGAVLVAVPVTAVRQAVPIELDGRAALALPRRAGALHSVLRYQGSTVPVVDLARWVELGQAPATSSGVRRALILQAGMRSVAILIDAVHGVVQLPPQSVQRVCHDESAEELFTSVGACKENGALHSLLEVERLMHLAAIWAEGAEGAVEEANAQTDAQAAAALADSVSLQVAVATVHGMRIGIEACAVGEVLPMPVLERLGASAALGLCRWRGRAVPVVDLAAAFGHAHTQMPARLLAVLVHDGFALGLAVHSVQHIQTIAVPQAEASLLTRLHPAMRAVVHDEEGAPVRVLDVAALLAQYPEAGISRSADQSVDRASTMRGGRRNEQSYIVFCAGTRMAAPIASLEEVLSLSAQAGVDMVACAVGRIGTLNWRGSAIEAVDLRAQDGRAREAGQVIVMRHDGRPRAFIVEAVEVLVPTNSASLVRVALAGAAPFDMLTVGEGAEQASFRTVELETLWPHSEARSAA